MGDRLRVLPSSGLNPATPYVTVVSRPSGDRVTISYDIIHPNGDRGHVEAVTIPREHTVPYTPTASDQATITYDPPPRARNTDPDTSHTAAAHVGDRHPVRTWIVNTLHRHGPLTDHDIAQHHRDDPTAPPTSPSGLRTRRAELRDAGIIRSTGRKRPVPPSGNLSTIWTLSDACR